MCIQIRFEDPKDEWHLTNAWFVKQSNFFVRFSSRIDKANDVA
jgi:hypothetical protein